MELTPCLGIGDFLLLKMSQISNHLDIRTIHLSRQLVYSYRLYPEQYITFLHRLLECLFPNVKSDIVDGPFNPIPTDQYFIKQRYIYDHIALKNRNKPAFDNYIVFHTKVRMENMIRFVTHDFNLLIKFFTSFKAAHNQTIILTGEKIIEECREKHALHIISLYQELLKALSINNKVLDLTKENLCSGNPDYEDFENDINLIHHANCNVSIGIGGNTHLCHAFSLKNITFCGPLDAYRPIIGYYPNTYQTVEPFLKNFTTIVNTMDELTVMISNCDDITISPWIRCAQERNIKVIYFLNKPLRIPLGNQYVYLKCMEGQDVSHKQNMGLQYIYERYNSKYVFCYESDTHVEILKILELIKNYKSHDRIILSGKSHQFCDGNGFIISRPMIAAMCQNYHIYD